MSLQNNERLAWSRSSGICQDLSELKLTLLFEPLLVDKSIDVKFLLEVIDQILQFLLFASRRVCVELSLSDRFEVSNCFFLCSLEQATVVCLPEVLAAAREDRNLVRVLVCTCSVSDVILYLPSIEEAFLLIEIIEQYNLSARILHSMRCESKHDQYLLVGVDSSPLVEFASHF